MHARTLKGILETEQNSFNTVRLLAAFAVFVSHSFLLLPFGAHIEPLDGAAYNLGQIAVNVFFFLSGVMLSRSYDLRPDALQFARARLVRIFPGLIVCGAVTAWVIGPINTALPLGTYFGDPQTLSYPFSVPLIFNAAQLPGVFAYGVEPLAVNAPLWTIKYELLAYLAFALIAATGLWPKGRTGIIVTVLLGVALSLITFTHVLDSVMVGSLLRFGFCFALGHFAFAHRDRIVLDGRAAVIGVIIAAPMLFSPLGALASVVSVSYLALVLGGVHFGRMGVWTRRTDLSYGIYLYAWPIQQMLISRFAHDGWEAIALAAMALMVTVAVAWLSWTCVEKPALSLKARGAAARSVPTPS